MSVEYVFYEERLSELFNDPSLEILSCFLATDNCMQVTYKKREDFLKLNRRAQMCLGASVCAKGRIFLYKAIQTLLANDCRHSLS